MPVICTNEQRQIIRFLRSDYKHENNSTYKREKQTTNCRDEIPNRQVVSV